MSEQEGSIESTEVSSPEVSTPVVEAQPTNITATMNPQNEKKDSLKPSGMDKLRDAAKSAKEGKSQVKEAGSKPTETPISSKEVEPPSKEVAPAPYTPNMKLKIMERDFEIDSFMKDVIKDKETEKKVRELYEKAIGLDFAKPKHEELKQQYQQFTKGFENLGGLLKEGRVQEFMDFWKIPKTELYKLVGAQLQYDDLPPEQKAEEDRKRALETESRQVREQNAQLLDQHQQMQVQHRTRELDTAISRPDVAQIAQEYDTRVGKPGAFREEVINRGRTAAVVHRVDLPVDKAVSEVMSMLGYMEQDVPEKVHEIPVVAPVQQKKLPVLPNIGSSGASPVTKSVKSLAELRAIGKEMRNG